MKIDNVLLDRIVDEAEKNPRLRMNFNFHDSLDAPAQRLVNVLLPGTELPVHRHLHTAETYVLLRGKIAVVFYDGNRCETERFILDPLAGMYGLHIPAGQWHTVEVIEPSAIFEVKDGPYTPVSPEDILS